MESTTHRLQADIMATSLYAAEGGRAGWTDDAAGRTKRETEREKPAAEGTDG